MDFALTPEQVLLQDSVRDMAARQIAPGAYQRQKTGIAKELIQELGQLGLLGVNLPEELGGAAAGVVAYAVALRQVAAADASVAVTMAVTNMVGEVIQRYGTQQQQRQHIPSLCSGEYFAGAFGLSESAAGSDPAAMQTRAVLSADGRSYCINGEKMWISSGDQAGVIILWARTDAPGSPASHRGISCFLLPAGVAGLRPGKPEEKMGLLASHTVPLSLVDVRLPASALLGQEGDGFGIAMNALDGGRIGIGAQSMGIAQAAIDECTAYVRNRRQFGTPLADFQAIQFKLADMRTQANAAWLLTLRAARLKERGVAFSREAAMAKVFASEQANHIVREAVQIHGGYGYMEESTVARLYRDCRATQIYEGTSEVQRLVISRQVLNGEGLG